MSLDSMSVRRTTIRILVVSQAYSSEFVMPRRLDGHP